MGISERTYTFRASAELGEKIREMGHVLAQLDLAHDARIADRVGRQVSIMLARRGGVVGAGLSGENQSAFLREAVELFVDAARKIASDLEWEKVYAAEWKAETEDDKERQRHLEALAGEAWLDT